MTDTEKWDAKKKKKKKRKRERKGDAGWRGKKEKKKRKKRRKKRGAESDRGGQIEGETDPPQRVQMYTAQPQHIHTAQSQHSIVTDPPQRVQIRRYLVVVRAVVELAAPARASRRERELGEKGRE